MAMTDDRPATGHPGRIFIDAAAYADFDGWHDAATAIRNATPVLRVTEPHYQPFWALTKHADVMEVERHPEVFTNEPASTLARDEQRRDLDPEATPSPVKTLINMDGDEHRDHRGLVNEWFKPGSIRKLGDRMAELSTRYVDQMAQRTECDFASDIAMQYPLQVILSILGLPESDYPRMLRLTQELFGSDDPDFTRGEESTPLEVILDFVQYFNQLTADRREHPGSDLASVIANAQLHGAPLPDLSIFGFYLIIATAGHDTTSSAIAGGLLALLEHPDQLARLQAEPGLIDNAVDEIVRWVSPVKHFMRTVHEPYTIRGVTFDRGDWVLLSYQSANRDEEIFRDPFTFDVGRADANMHLGFGFGRHYCLGAHLAKLEMRAMFRELIPRIEHIELAGTPTLMHSNLVSGPKTLPVRYKLR